MTTMVFRYGIATPHEGLDEVYAQMRLAHEYRRNLIIIERGRRAAERQIRSEFGGEASIVEAQLVGIKAACDWLAAEIRVLRKNSRKRSETAAMRLQLAAARAKAKAVREHLYELRRMLAPQCAECRKAGSEEMPCPHATPEAVALRHRLDGSGAIASDLIKNAREHSGLYWGTYLLVERAMQASRSAPLYEKDGITPHDPKLPPPRWDGDGTVGVQIQSSKPLSVEQALAGADTRLAFVASPWPEQWLATADLTARPPRREDSIIGTGRGRRPPGVRPGERGQPDTAAPTTRPDGTPARWVSDRACRHGELRMRVGSTSGAPVWARWRLDYHRPLPAGAQITWAAVHRTVRGPHAEWSLCVTVELSAPLRAPHADGPRPTVAIDVGWRIIGDEIRVAAWTDSSGQTGELRLTAADIRALRAAEDLRAQRDVAMDACKATVKRWISAQAHPPQWMRDASAHMHSWRRASRLVVLLRQWDAERPSPSADERIVVEALRAWTMADRAKWASEASRRIWGLRRRRDKYRVFAAQMCARYEAVVLEKFDLRDVAERPQTGEDSAENEMARSNRQLAAISELRGCLLNAAPRREGIVVAVDAARTTSTCPSCGLVADRDAAASVRLRCECGHEWDQDREGAAPMLLRRYSEKPGDAKILAGARGDDNVSEGKPKKSAKWARAKRMSAAKKQRMAERSQDGL